ncbi:CU044_2847 family protein [Streptomyces sp. NPDC020192]|uniref:CU044_2847 family protein n=1 Tax=Streptomyces sp. NPDC020192 TaxID=3365066 RepID=UPI0037AA583B
MKHLVEMPINTASGPTQIVQVEIEHAPVGPVKVSRPGQVVARATHTLGEMLAGIRPLAEGFLDGFAGMAEAPNEIGLEFGLSLSADANLVVATTAAQANFKITLNWHPTAESVPAPQPGPTGSAS